MNHKRVVIPRHGGPEVLQVIEEPVPEPGDGEVRVKVLTSGVAFADVLVREGLYPGVPKPPVTPGYDLVGVVDAVGSNVYEVAPGERVAALTVVGGYAETICLPENELVNVPDDLDPAAVNALVLNYVTAYQMLHRVARVARRDPVLVHGAAGGVGTALLQLGRLHELQVFGTASKGKHALVQAAGAVPIDYQSEDFVSRVKAETEGGAAAAFDPIGGKHFWRSYKALRRGGRLVAYGVSAATKGGRKAHPLVAPLSFGLLGATQFIPDGKKAGFYSITKHKAQNLGAYKDDLTKLIGLLREGGIAPVVAERLPLAQAQRAHELLGQAAVRGKIVLACNEV